MIGKYYWKLHADGTATCRHVEHGNGRKPILVWYRDSKHIVFKVPSGKHWGGRLESSVSHPGSYIVGRIITTDGDEVLVEQIFEMPISKRKA